VFQQHALFPHLNIAKNILFGANSRDNLPKLLAKLLADFHLEGKENCFPHELSGGEQQRVALARALAAKPRVLLMDEPFASIDSVLRRKIRTECIDVLRQAGVTTMIVTHDAEEAMELSDYIHVMDQGRLTQSGTARALYTEPSNSIVAGLFGEINHITDQKTIYALTGRETNELLLRPEALKITDAPSSVTGTISRIYFRGNHYLLHIMVTDNITLKIQTHKQGYEAGDSVHIQLA
jgi:ABC-type Fe3+/spermidine/putrescine transport system ATPase subunit